MKRILAALCAITVVAACFAGCGKKGEASGRSAYNYNMSEYVTLSQYSGIEIDKTSESYKNYSESFFENLVASKSLYGEVTDKTHAVASGETVNISYSGKYKDNGKIFTGDTSDEKNDGFEDYALNIGSGAFIPGFEDKLIGAKVGSTVTFDITFPSDYGNEELNGRLTTFTVKINSIQVLPELTDDLAVKLGYESAAALTAEQEKSTVQNCIYDKIMSESKVVKYPDVEKGRYDTLYNEYITYATQQVEAYNKQYGYNMDVATMVYYMFGVSQDGLRSGLDAQLDRDMIFFAIYDDAKLSYAQTDYDNTVNELASSSGITADQVKEQYEAWMIETQTVVNFVMNYLTDSAVIK